MLSQVSLLSQVKFPATPAGSRAKEILDVINSGDNKKAKNYVNENFDPQFRDAFPIEQHVGLLMMLKDQHKALELAKVNSSDKNDISFLLHSSSSDGWINIELWVNESDPYKISKMGIRPGAAPVKKNDEGKKDKMKNSSSKKK
jgi:hypothetical protein